MVTDSTTELIWIIFTSVGLVINWRILHLSLRDLHWIQISGLNGSNERDQFAAVFSAASRFLIQMVFFFGGIICHYVPDAGPDGVAHVDKMTVATIVVVISSLILSISGIKSLRLRRLQVEEYMFEIRTEMHRRKPRSSKSYEPES